MRSVWRTFTSPDSYGLLLLLILITYMFGKKHNEVLVYFATLAGVLLINLLGGVGIGLALSAFFVLQRLSHTEIKSEQRDGNWHPIVLDEMFRKDRESQIKPR